MHTSLWNTFYFSHFFNDNLLAVALIDFISFWIELKFEFNLTKMYWKTRSNTKKCFYSTSPAQIICVQFKNKSERTRLRCVSSRRTRTGRPNCANDPTRTVSSVARSLSILQFGIFFRFLYFVLFRWFSKICECRINLKES